MLSFLWCPHTGREKIEGRGGMGPPVAGSCHTRRGARLALGCDARPRAEERAGGAGAGWKPNPAPGRAAPALPKPQEPPAREGTRVTRSLGRGDHARRPLQGRGGGTRGVLRLKAPVRSGSGSQPTVGTKCPPRCHPGAAAVPSPQEGLTAAAGGVTQARYGSRKCVSGTGGLQQRGLEGWTRGQLPPCG